MSQIDIPEQFIKWAYLERAQLIQRQAAGEEIEPNEIFLGFSRHTPAIVSNGPAGLNASIKGIGFLPKTEYLQDTLNAYLEHIDFNRFGTLELVCAHTWENIQVDPKVTLLFYQPPMISFEVRGYAEIHTTGSVYHQLINAQYDVYHRPNPQGWKERPAYVFNVEEIFDNSVTHDGFGTKIFGM